MTSQVNTSSNMTLMNRDVSPSGHFSEKARRTSSKECLRHPADGSQEPVAERYGVRILRHLTSRRDRQSCVACAFQTPAKSAALPARVPTSSTETTPGSQVRFPSGFAGGICLDTEGMIGHVFRHATHPQGPIPPCFGVASFGDTCPQGNKGMQ